MEHCSHREREVFAERLKAVSRVKEGGEEREDVGKWQRRPFNHQIPLRCLPRTPWVVCRFEKCSSQ